MSLETNLIPATDVDIQTRGQKMSKWSRFSHLAPGRRLWEYIILILSVGAPIEISFIYFVDPDISIYLYMPFFLIDIFFILDQYVIRRTCILEGGREIDDLQEISKDYGKVYMIIHIISLVPLGWIGILLGNELVYVILSLNKLLRLIRGYKAYKIVNNALPYVGGRLGLISFFSSFLLTIYVLTMAFYIIAKYEGFDNSWAATFYSQGYNSHQIFVVTFYFVLTIITTTGFGDIVPANTLETIVTIVIQTYGVCFNVYNTSFLVSLLIDQNQSEFLIHFESAKKYMEWRKVPAKDEMAARDFCQYQYDTNRGTGGIHQIMKMLPGSVRTRLKMEMTKSLFEQTVAFKELNVKQLSKVADLLKHITFSPDEVIFSQGELSKKMYFFKSGFAKVIVNGLEVATENCDNGIVTGESQMLTSGARPVGMQAITYVSAWVMEVDSLKELIRQRSDMRYSIMGQMKAHFPEVYGKIEEVMEGRKK